MKMKLAEIAKAISVENDISRWQDVEVSSVAFDSRQIANGALFVPLTGQQDGHKFVQNAFEHGASATLWASDHPIEKSNQPILVVKDPLKALQELSKYYLSKINPFVVAVTGSNGKTTTKDMIASILSTQMNVTKTYENFNNQIGVPVTLLNMESNTEAVVVEMGMDHFGELDFLTKMVNPDIAVITMIGEAHIEFFGTRDKIADAKMEITHGLKEDGTFVFNGDEPLLTQRAKQVDQEQRTFGRQLENNLYATSVNLTSHEIKFTTNMWPDTEFTVPMMGEYNINNALAALSVADLMRISSANMQTGLAHVELTQNRAQWIAGKNGEQILSDVYNSNPTAAKQVLHAFALTQTEGQRVAVLGDMLELGDAAANLHASLAQELDPAKIQSVFLIGPHMKALRDELQNKYSADALHYFDIEQKEQMTAQLQDSLTNDDIVLLKASHGIHLETVLESLK
ncbi:UDP-N-acetylmuramoyl-tripeptide--D-alanyl-D-alanine ligase [Paucilactobacillus hokkaidonensis JCM 18461]|uniref:UDP-N-acetylmuramoyl-tripeptide--D-alanyl-D-alanine ligase n=2 Tax=Paucilactobacillus hokkaidonensis TaxID=1193095 RepID=A0A0A1GVT0_9LACO|nr:UDP-N-acetylmuramoyl-tripeptide--D-alanyl-D-alanine ligase [Paucilactobacillus hokkaidonensis]KRO09712.1 UDP-N-acetylmuramoyl-tripeptide--D-alanyl-D-alanine ligase [Paucilactobacillus hokkaidonensis]BAP84968.1 UDP-N-acetylmuramoyl-tripeptide--D-alanyl-D-alanine ligase [Paucilactobacillus hokkaidonensis JCM 18461]